MTDRELLLAATDKIVALRRLLGLAVEALEPMAGVTFGPYEKDEDELEVVWPESTGGTALRVGDYRRAARVRDALRKELGK